MKTFRRADLLGRMLASLAAAGDVQAVVVMGDEDDPATERVARGSSLLREYLPQSGNLGQGAGHAAGLRAAAADPEATHFLLLDDDVVLRPGAVSEMVRAIVQNGAGAAVPMLINAQGHVAWFPGVSEARKFRVLREPNLTPAEYIRRCGDIPATFTWAPWPVLLVTRTAVTTVGLPREDFPYAADDLEFALRLSWHFQALFVPRAVVEHLPPRRKTGTEAYYIDCLHVQNLAYVSLRLRHGRRALRHLPGGCWRFLRPRKFDPSAMLDLARALWRGGIRGRPGGVPGADQFWTAFKDARPQ